MEQEQKNENSKLSSDTMYIPIEESNDLRIYHKEEINYLDEDLRNKMLEDALSNVSYSKKEYKDKRKKSILYSLGVWTLIISLFSISIYFLVLILQK
ncbi:hypothetical protein [Mycoplasmopsis gallinarum]|uniref:hypothetical protein n=1 Tax=Mycoplasmopsis gallinarum TaxID=29557 RepID=UPI0004890AD6|nr:hypothetical protein [Mycoplasmopsis gallinarum]